MKTVSIADIYLHPCYPTDPVTGLREIKRNCLNRVISSPAGVYGKNISINVNQYTKTELKVICSNANTALQRHCAREGFDRYPCIIVARASPQQMRGWLLYHFPREYYNGSSERGAIAGHRVNRGIEITHNGVYRGNDGARVAGMKRF